MPFDSPKRAVALGIPVLAGILALWWIFAPQRAGEPPAIPPPPAPASAPSAPGNAEAPSAAPSSARRPLPPVLARLLQAHRERDRAAEDRWFSELEKQLLQAGPGDAGLVGAVVDLVHDGSMDSGLRLGLVQALIQGASPVVVPRIIGLFHTTEDPEIKRAILRQLSDIQGDARLIDQGVNVTPELVAAFSAEAEDSPLLVPLTVALTKMGDAKALGFLIGLVSSRAPSLDALRTSGDIRMRLAYSALAENTIPSDAAVPELAGKLAAPSVSPVETYMTLMTLASIGSTGAMDSLMAYFEAAPDSQAGTATAVLSRLNHPETVEVLQASLDGAGFKSAAVKKAVEGIVEELKR